MIVAAPVCTVCTIVNAMIGHQNFEQAHTTAIFGKTVANSAGNTIANSLGAVFPVAAARCTRNIVFCCIREYFKSLLNCFCFHFNVKSLKIPPVEPGGSEPQNIGNCFPGNTTNDNIVVNNDDNNIQKSKHQPTGF